MFHPEGPTLWELAQQALSSTDRGYDLIAPKFDYTPFRTPDPILERVAKHTGAPGSVKRGLDVCCGTGAGLRWFRPLCSERIVGIDRSPGMLQEAERRLKDAPGDAPIEFVRGDALDLPFGREFDLATCFGAFGHIREEDEPRFVESLAKVLVPGGRFVFVTSDMPPSMSKEAVLSKGFNAVMRVRNAILKPEFVMYYLTFLLPGCKWLLESKGFDVKVENPFGDQYARARLVTATRRK
jgi:ubiquinone/menaquinone biosynthesis C-methylase UbiE